MKKNRERGLTLIVLGLGIILLTIACVALAAGGGL